MSNRWLTFSFVLIILLLSTFAVVALTKYRKADAQLDKAADMIEEIGRSRFEVIAEVDDTMPLSTTINIPVSVPVRVSMNLSIDAPFTMNVPVNQELNIPFHLDIQELIPIDTVFHFPDAIAPYVNDSFGLATKMDVRIFPGFRVPFRVSGIIPLNENLSFEMPSMRVKAVIPIEIDISESIPVKLSFNLPLNQNINLPLHINTAATISFIQEIPVHADFPVHLAVPVPVDFGSTPLKPRFDSLSRMLRDVL